MLRLGRGNLLLWVLLIVLGLLVVYPLLMLLYGSIRSAGPGVPGSYTLQGYVAAYSNPETYGTFLTTFWLGVVRAVLALSIAVFLSWVVTRTDTPWRNGLEVLIWLKFFLPAQPLVMAWILLLSPKAGFINVALMKILGLEKAPLDVYSYGGIIWVSSIQWAAVIFMLITPAFRGMDAALEESSRMAGSNGRTTLLRITLPLLAPAILGASMLVFIRIMESFETELLLGYSKGIFVYTTRVYDLIAYFPIDYPQGMALSTVFLLLVFGIIALQWKLLGGKQFVTVTGRGFATRPTRLGRWRYVTFGLVILYFTISTFLPLAVLALGTFMKLFGIFVAEPFTTQHWAVVFSDELFWGTFRNTLIVGVSAATIGMVLYSIISYTVIRTKFRGRHALDFLSWLPWGVPGLVMALGFLWAYVGGVKLPFTLYGTLYLMILVFVVRGLPLGVRTMNGAMVQLGNELEESSRVLGASWAYTFRRIIAPLLTPSFISAWLILFLISIRDLVTVVLLYTPNSRMLSIIMLEYWFGGAPEKAMVIGMVTSVLMLGFALLARHLGSRREVAA